jgi:hypothetical protein
MSLFLALVRQVGSNCNREVEAQVLLKPLITKRTANSPIA